MKTSQRLRWQVESAVCITGGTPILVLMLKFIGPIVGAMGRLWGLSEIRALLSWLRPGLWMLQFAG